MSISLVILTLSSWKVTNFTEIQLNSVNSSRFQNNLFNILFSLIFGNFSIKSSTWVSFFNPKLKFAKLIKQIQWLILVFNTFKSLKAQNLSQEFLYLKFPVFLFFRSLKHQLNPYFFLSTLNHSSLWKKNEFFLKLLGHFLLHKSLKNLCERIVYKQCRSEIGCKQRKCQQVHDRKKT